MMKQQPGSKNRLGRPNYQPEEDAVILEFAKTETAQQIATRITALGFREATDSSVTFRAGKLRKLHPDWDVSLNSSIKNQAKCKLTPHEKALVVALKQERVPQYVIAEKMEVSEATISKILKRAS